MNKTAMKKHEDVCWYNPKNKTCVTCKYADIEIDYCEHPELDDCPTERWSYRICNHTDRIANAQFEDLKPKINCLFWEDWSEIEEA